MKKIIQLLGIFAITASSAFADITVNSTVDDTLSNLSANNNTCDLREAIQNANDGAQTYNDCPAGAAGADIIKFTSSGTITLVDDIFIISDITIKGPITLSGGNNTSMFTVSSGSNGKLRIIDNTKLENGKDASGGAIRLNDLDNLFQCRNSSFKNNTADNNGGAILSSGVLDIDTCKFENNKAGNDGGAIWKGGGSSGIATMTINVSDFIDNQAGTDTDEGGEGGAIFFAGGTTIGNITTSRFDGNSAQSGEGSTDNNGGGAINNAGVLNITASAFAGNKVKAANNMSSQKWHGGAIFNESSGILAVNFSHFGQTPIPLPPPFDSLTAANETTADEGDGGAIYNFGDMFILGSSFIGNKSSHNGGAIATATLTDSFANMVLEVLFGGATVANSMFSGNAAINQGGALYNLRDDVNVKIINTTIANNTALEGGGLYNEGDGDNGAIANDEFILLNTIVANNSALTGANCGGGTSSSEGTNNIVYPAGSGCPNSPSGNGDPALNPVPELTFSIPLILNYSLPLNMGSSALGTGDPLTCANFPIINLDQRGFPRPMGDTNCDVGSYESGNVGMPSNTPTFTPTNTPTNTSTATSTNTPTNTPTDTSTPTVTNTPTNTFTPSLTPTITNTPTITLTPTNTITGTLTNTFTPTETFTQTNTSTPTETFTQTNTATPTETFTQTNTFTATSTGTITETYTPSATATWTNTVTTTNTFTFSPTPTLTNTFTSTSTGTITETYTPSPTATGSLTVTETPTLTATATVSNAVTVPQNVTPGSSNDPGCTGTDIQSSQFLLDGQAAKQKRLVLRARALAVKAGATTTQKTKLDKLVQNATSAYIRMWSGIWSYERIIVKCSNTVLCNSVDISTTAKAFDKDSDLMVSLLNDSVKVLRGITGNKKSGAHLVKQMKNLDGLNFASLGNIPAEKSVCN